MVVDNGDILSRTEKYPLLAAGLITEAMSQMGYECLNPGELDFLYGKKVIGEISEKANFPLVSTNIVAEEIKKPYLIKQVSGIRIGVLGVTSPDLFKGNTVKVRDPRDAILKVLPELKKKSDVIVLLAHMPLKEAKKLLSSLRGIDVAILGHGFRVLRPVKINDTVMMAGSYKGEYVGVLTLNWDSNKKKVTGFEGKLVRLKDGFKNDPKIVKLVRKYAEIAKKRERIMLVDQKKREEAARKLLKMTPEEFIEFMKKKHPQMLLRRGK